MREEQHFIELLEAHSAVDAHSRWSEWLNRQYNKEQITFSRLSQAKARSDASKIVWIAHYTIDTRWSGLHMLGRGLRRQGK